MENWLLPQTDSFYPCNKKPVQPTITLSVIEQVNMTTNMASHRLPPLAYPKSMSPSHDSTVVKTQGQHTDVEGCDQQEMPISHDDQDGQVVRERRDIKAVRRKELARRHLSNSLQGGRTVLPELTRTMSFSVSALNSFREQGKPSLPRRETGSLGPRKPAHDPDVRGLRRTHSLREADRRNGSSHLLSMSLPAQPHRHNISLAALVHELNAAVHYSSPSKDLSRTDYDDDDDTSIDFAEYDNGLDPDLCPRLTGKDTNDASYRTLTPALRKLNRRRVSSRIRTQQWVNQIEREQRCSERSNKFTRDPNSRNTELSLLFEQET